MKLKCVSCGVEETFRAEPKKRKIRSYSAVEVASAKGWWHLGDGRRGRCPKCEDVNEGANHGPRTLP